MHWILLSSILLGGAAGSAPDVQAASPPVVLELFTSEGCSSCPPADRYLRELGRTEDEQNLILLAWHVDYWDYIGWADPYARKAWSQRQRDYARKRGDSRVYTPQLVVNGRTHAVGSDRRVVQSQIAAARKRGTKGRVEIDLGGESGARLHAQLDSAAAGRAEVVAVFFENDLRTDVARGENRGRTLAESYVVRRRVSLGTISPGHEQTFVRKLDVDPSWQRERLGVAVLLQDEGTLEIYAAARGYLAH